jgi:protease-4
MKKNISILMVLAILLTNGAFAQGFLDSLLGKQTKSQGNELRVKFVEGNENVQEEVLLIKLSGVIQEKEEDSMPLKASKSMVDELKKDLKLLTKRESIKAAIIEINSPGGEVTCSDILYNLIQQAKKESNKPVVALIGAMGASGAYYIACAADEIYAHPTSIIGSIGVIMQSINIERLAEAIGIKPVVLKSDKTPMKDILSPYREMTEAERASLIDIIEHMYNRFVEIVAKSRNLSKEETIRLANGSLYSSQKAKEEGLIDQIGYREDAFKQAYSLADLDTAALVQRTSKKGLGEILGDLAEINSGAPLLINQFKTIMEGNTQPQLLFK